MLLMHSVSYAGCKRSGLLLCWEPPLQVPSGVDLSFLLQAQEGKRMYDWGPKKELGLWGPSRGTATLLWATHSASAYNKDQVDIPAGDLTCC